MGTRAEGLTADEAQKNQEKFGNNVIAQKKGKPEILIFLSNFASLMAILLWVAGIISFIAKMPELGIAVWLVKDLVIPVNAVLIAISRGKDTIVPHGDTAICAGDNIFALADEKAKVAINRLFSSGK